MTEKKLNKIIKQLLEDGKPVTADNIATYSLFSEGETIAKEHIFPIEIGIHQESNNKDSLNITIKGSHIDLSKNHHKKMLVDSLNMVMIEIAKYAIFTNRFDKEKDTNIPFEDFLKNLGIKKYRDGI